MFPGNHQNIKKELQLVKVSTINQRIGVKKDPIRNTEVKADSFEKKKSLQKRT